MLHRLLLALLVFSTVGCASHLPARPGEKVHRNLLFASPQGHDLHMDLYVPRPGPDGKPAPVVVWVFGGSWKFGSKGFHLVLRDLPRHGIAVAAIEYRFSRVAKYPAQLEDCRAAVKWLQENGSRYGVDASRMGASGESAGALLAANLGLIDGPPAIRAVCALYPPTDLVSLGRMYVRPDKIGTIEKLIGGDLEEKIAVARDACPVNHVSSRAAPFLIMHGGFDGIVPVEESETLHEKLLKAGVDSQFIVFPFRHHWFNLSDKDVARVAAFFHKHLDHPSAPQQSARRPSNPMNCR